ncbi:hypothetical protein LMG3458_02465 [Achromobacter deleyi]|uniref:DUF8033 domain-containing protein n=1 Tax=Achromobacter deleyi TaxID=1353891 RepID=A0A6S6ZUK5_9BURK|nr:hypothetical protein [Achromobacter deleyi]CAB3697465.1 hypothetical protein LMG3458_02465 [Achromobacter deleyi]
MKLIPVKPNGRDPVVLEYRDGTRLLFSYETPVAAYIPGGGFIVTNEEVSPTTAKRIQAWIGSQPARGVEQADIFAVITTRPVLTRD